MNKFRLFAAITFFLSAAASAHDWPDVMLCQPFHGCKDGTPKLTTDEENMLQQLLNAVKPGASEAQVSTSLGERPFRQIPAMKSLIGPPGTLISGVYWWTSSKRDSSADPHVDVAFMNDKASSFRWYMARGGLGKYIQVIGPEDLVLGKKK